MFNVDKILKISIETMTEEELSFKRSEKEQLVLNVKEFLKDGCKCSRGPKDGPCSSQFTEEAVMANLNNCLKLSSKELDLAILANNQAVTHTEKHWREKEQKSSMQ